MLNEVHQEIINVILRYKSNPTDETKLIALETMRLYFIDKTLEHPKMLEQNTFEDIVKKATMLAEMYINS